MMEIDGREDELQGGRPSEQTTSSSGQLRDAPGVCAAQQPTDGAIFPRNTARESAVVDASKGYTPLNSSARSVSWVNSPLQLLRSMRTSIWPDRRWGLDIKNM
jgi:hypothetical protein